MRYPTFHSDRPRRRKVLSLVALAVAALIVVALVEGAKPSQSRPYRQAVILSYADLLGQLIHRSNQIGAEVHDIVGKGSTMSRTKLYLAVEGAYVDSEQLYRDLGSLRGISPSLTVQKTADEVFADRVNCLYELRSAIRDALPEGANDRSNIEAAQHSAAEAFDYLDSSDRAMIRLQSMMHALSDKANLPSSEWELPGTVWNSSYASSFVQSLAGSPTLAPVHEVVLASVSITPPAESHNGTASVLPPTKRLDVSVLVDNEGNLYEKGVVVKASLVPQSGKATASTSTRSISLAMGQRREVLLPPLRAVEGATYQLVVSVTPVPGQTSPAGTSTTYTIQIAS